MCMSKRIRVNVTVDADLLSKAKSKLNMFGGKLSTLFNIYLEEFVNSIEDFPGKKNSLNMKVRALEERVRKLEHRA